MSREHLPRFVTPCTRRGWLLLIAFMVVIAAGCWPVIALLNHPARVLGLPLIGLWAYVIVLASVAVMALGNCWLDHEENSEASAPPPNESEHSP